MWFRRRKQGPIKKPVLFLVAVFVATALYVGLQLTKVEAALDEPSPPFHYSSPVRPTFVDFVDSPAHEQVSGVRRLGLQARLQEAIHECNKDLKNNVDRHIGCFLVRDAVVIGDRIRYDASKNEKLPSDFPGRLSARSRHHMRSIALEPWRDAADKQRALDSVRGYKMSPQEQAMAVRNVTLAYYQAPVIGAQYRNAWHTFGDFFTMMHHTVAPLLFADNSTMRVQEIGRTDELTSLKNESNGENRTVEEVSVEVEDDTVIPPLWWLTRTSKTTLGKDCNSHESCSRSVLFDPFARLFQNRFTFIDANPQRSVPLHVEYLLIGLNSRCSPIPTDDVESPTCHHNLELVRDRVLSMYHLGPQRSVTESEKRCPVVHIMSRQGDHYRHMTPFEEILTHMREEFTRVFSNCPVTNLQVIKLTSQVPFIDQIASLRNATVLWAGRGGGTAYSIFLPTGGVYISISGNDRWSPYRGLVPQWIHMVHQRAKLVDPHDPQRPAPRFKNKGGGFYSDPNRAAYLIKHPKEFAKESIRLMEGLLQQHPSSSNTSAV